MSFTKGPARLELERREQQRARAEWDELRLEHEKLRHQEQHEDLPKIPKLQQELDGLPDPEALISEAQTTAQDQISRDRAALAKAEGEATAARRRLQNTSAVLNIKSPDDLRRRQAERDELEANLKRFDEDLAAHELALSDVSEGEQSEVRAKAKLDITTTRATSNIDAAKAQAARVTTRRQEIVTELDGISERRRKVREVFERFQDAQRRAGVT